MHPDLMKAFRISLGLAAVLFLNSCNHTETVPNVEVRPNHSGFNVAKIRTHGPEDGFMQKLPSGVSITIQHPDPTRNPTPGYYIAGDQALDVLSLRDAENYPNIGRKLVRDWQTFLQSPGSVRPEDLPGSEIPWINAACMFHAKLRVRTFPWGRAVLFIASYAQGGHGGPVNNEELVLVIQGITNDGQYAVHAHLPIRHPKLPDSARENRHNEGKIYFAFDSEYKAAERWLTAQPDNSFFPTLQQYEELLSSLVIGRPS